MRFYFLVAAALFTAGCSGPGGNNANTPGVNNGNTNNTKPKPVATISSYEVVRKYPHDSKAFTQGLVFRNGFLYESTGEYEESTLRKVELDTGRVVQKHDLPPEVFGEGIAIMGDKIYQLSWRNRTAWIYDLDFKLQREVRYSGEGWGLASDDSHLWLSDGTHVIRVLNPETFETVRTIVVKDENGRPLMQLNELEFVKGELWANVWHSENIGKPNHIARIDPNTGNLLGWIDLSGISPEDQGGEEKSENTLNGIAYDASGDRIFVTGKNWKNLYEIKLKPKQ
jgi:glutaminyl-peptide cyclotransferase